MTTTCRRENGKGNTSIFLNTAKGCLTSTTNDITVIISFRFINEVGNKMGNNVGNKVGNKTEENELDNPQT